MHFRTYTKVWDCYKRVFVADMKRWDGHKWCDLPIEEITQFRYRVSAFGTVREGDILAIWEGRWPRETFEARRYFNTLTGKWQLILAPIPAPDAPPA